ncbi:hypothetical protein RB597_008511 [Gaeumannomyces tritici]
MAISDRIPGLEVTVKVDGERATEHHDDAAYDEPCAVKLDSPDGVRVVKYIEATSGAPFSVHIKRTSGFNFRGNHIGWSVAVDGGQLCKKQEVSPRTRKRGAEWSSEMTGYFKGDSVSGFIKKRWKFGDLDIVSADTHITAEMMAKQMLLAKSLGVITVGVYHLLRPNRVKPWRAKPHDDINTGPINEKALKGRALSLKTTIPFFKAPTPSPAYDQRVAIFTTIALWIRSSAPLPYSNSGTAPKAISSRKPSCGLHQVLLRTTTRRRRNMRLASNERQERLARLLPPAVSNRAAALTESSWLTLLTTEVRTQKGPETF